MKTRTSPIGKKNATYTMSQRNHKELIYNPELLVNLCVLVTSWQGIKNSMHKFKYFLTGQH